MPQLISRLFNFVNDKNNGIPITSSRVDAELNQLVSTMNQAAIIQATAPSAPINGQLWVDSTNNVLKEYRFNEWILIGPVQIGTVMATTAAGDIWIDNSGAEIVINVRNKANTAWIALVQPSSLPTAATGLLPSGAIIMWSGTIATIPSGFFLCNGSNGTPDLRNRFIVGADADVSSVAKSTVTGTALQTSEGQLPSTSLNLSKGYGDSGGSFGQSLPTDGVSPATGNLTVSFGTGTANVSRFYALAYIMKS